MFYKNLNIKKTPETSFLNILERESEQNFTRVSPFAKKEIYLLMIYCTEAIITQQAYLALCKYISNYISNHTQHEQLYILLLSMH